MILFSVGIVCGAPMSGKILDKYGMKWTIIFNGILVLFTGMFMLPYIYLWDYNSLIYFGSLF